MVMTLVMLTIVCAAALWTVMTRSLLRAGIGLALTSAVLAVVIFRLGSPLAAVFELSVCAGLISVLFISTISLTEPLTPQEVMQHMKERFSRFWILPVVVIAGGVLLFLVKPPRLGALPGHETEHDVRTIMWNLRQIDLVGQIIILLAGVFGVVILFREMRNNGR